MNYGYTPLREITDKTRFYTCKITVLHKGRPQHPPNKPRYQRLVFIDNEGFTMKATIFGPDIEAYAEALLRNGEYEISNAAVKGVPVQYASKENEYAMTINRRADINPLIHDQSLLGPRYQDIATIPFTDIPNVLYDMVAVIIWIGESKQVTLADRTPSELREIYIVDSSCDRPYMVSAWNEMGMIDRHLLATWSQTYTVVGFCALKAKTYKGFTLTTTMSTEIIHNPSHSKADELRVWATQNSKKLSEYRLRLKTLLSPTNDHPIITVEDLNSRKAHDTWQEERFGIRVILPVVSVENLYLYMGCSNCGKTLAAEFQTNSGCVNCYCKTAAAIPRATLKATASDNTGQLELYFYSNDVETLTGLSCTELWAMKNNSDKQAETLGHLRTVSLLLIVGPTVELARSRILKWAVRSVTVG